MRSDADRCQLPRVTRFMADFARLPIRERAGVLGTAGGLPATGPACRHYCSPRMRRLPGQHRGVDNAHRVGVNPGPSTSSWTAARRE